MIQIDMPMPESCAECRFSQGGYMYCHAMPENFCGYVNYYEEDGKPEWCPLKAQEPRVMGVGDLYGEDMGFYERKDEELVWPVLIARGGPDCDGTVGIVRKDAFEIKADCDLINQTWRLWTAYPTAAQREATPWD